jgi:hypothetical protein
LNPRAGVDVFARVGGDVLANASDRANNNGLTGTAGGLGSVDLPNGNYDYVGELKVTAIVSPALITTGQAFSDFNLLSDRIRALAHDHRHAARS